MCRGRTPKLPLPGFRRALCGNAATPACFIVQAFIAKAVYQYPTTRVLLNSLKANPTLRRLCGWDSVSEIPSESTFSRAFAAFSHQALPHQLHEAIVQENLGAKLAGHVSRGRHGHRRAPEAGSQSPRPALRA
jgi:hypothetical protein